MLLTMLGYVLLIIPGIYLSVAYLMSYSLMIDRNIGVWQALEASRKAITRHWFKILFLYLLMAGMSLLAAPHRPGLDVAAVFHRPWHPL